MRGKIAYLFAAAMVVAPLLSATVASAQTDRRDKTVAANSCPVGTHWQAADYVKHGKWREADCVRN